MAEVIDVYARRVLQKYRFRPDEWDFTGPQMTQLIIETPWTKVATDGLVRLKDEDGGDEVHVRSFNNSIHPVTANARGLGTEAVPLAVTASTILGDFSWFGQFSTTVEDLVEGARIRGVAEGTFAAANFSQSDSQIGGDTINSSWAAGFGSAKALAADQNGSLFCAPTDGGTNQFWQYDIGTTTWTQRSPGWGLITNALAMGHLSGNIYTGINNVTSRVWQYNIAGNSHVEVGNATDLSPADTSIVSMYIDESADRVYVGSGTTKAAIYHYHVGTDTWTRFGWGSAHSSFTFTDNGSQAAKQVFSIAKDDASAYIWCVVQHNLGSAYSLTVWRYDLSLLSWSQIGGGGANGLTIADANPGSIQSSGTFAFGRYHFTTHNNNTPASGRVYQFDDDTDTWYEIGGGGTGWSGNARAITTAPDGSLLVSVTDTGGDVELWNYTVTGVQAKQSGTWTLLYTFAAGYDMMRALIFDESNILYSGMGASTSDADVWGIGSFSGTSAASSLELYISTTASATPVLSQKWFFTEDVGIGGENTDGIYYDHSTRAVGIMDTGKAPARTLHIAGDDGMRLAASAAPGTPGTGDIIINSGNGNWLEWYDGTVWRTAVDGPASVTDGAVALFDGTSGDVIKEGGVLKDPQDYEWRPTTTGDPDDPQLIFDSNGEVVTEVIFIG